MEQITFHEYLKYSAEMKIEVKIGNIVEVERIPKNKKMIRIVATFGEGDTRTVISNIGGVMEDVNVLLGMNFPFVTNLIPAMQNGFLSEAMIMFTLGKPGTNLF